ncbi:DUF1524 domain-containing protein [Arthrobacter zhangbolii]|uniref:DUF1524 domain-containing protein n=1 Tax=Arthrobacter zhangbolii TaxID=2886936 RepID=A0A9X1S955_9MICC|nr:DUF1524 domain-containing protein [Arthrobacter zhangbolii]MCC3273340.1 DUF1524 domain-containing protein [Arthrobacter zhangbolii]UON92681.1 DUF1524 domain-containing protein [Arthrobacter zhangbolii]
MTSLRTKVLSLLALPAVLFGAAACTPVAESVPGAAPSSAAAAPAVTETPADSAAAPAETPAPSAAAGTALEQLAGIPIKGRAPKTGYDREQFGPAWADTDRNGCDTRNDILARDLVDVVYKDGTKECVVASGTFLDPYTGATIGFVRGNTTSTAVQIDHVVALSDAWQKGAQQLSAEERRLFANDPLNLMAADGPANGAKSDGDAATWLPANKAFRCEYVARQTAVKAEYRLWMTQAEHDAIATVLAGCPDQPVPERAGTASASVAAGTGAGVAEAAVKPGPGTAPFAGDAAPVYANCSAVKAAGAAPIRTGDPGWDPKFDRDGDGVGCES